VFLALAGVAYWWSTRERVGLWLGAAAMTPAIALSLLFPEGGAIVERGGHCDRAPPSPNAGL